jgi:hypothetical protein
LVLMYYPWYLQVDQWMHSLWKELYWLQPPMVKSNRGHQFKIGPADQFYIGWAHQYIKAKGTCIGGPGRYKIGRGDQSFIGHLQPTLPRGVVTDTTPLAVTGSNMYGVNFGALHKSVVCKILHFYIHKNLECTTSHSKFIGVHNHVQCPPRSI